MLDLEPVNNTSGRISGVDRNEHRRSNQESWSNTDTTGWWLHPRVCDCRAGTPPKLQFSSLKNGDNTNLSQSWRERPAEKVPTINVYSISRSVIRLSLAISSYKNSRTVTTPVLTYSWPRLDRQNEKNPIQVFVFWVF